MEHAVAVVGMAGRFPGAHDVDAFWDNLRHGRCTIARFARAAARDERTTGDGVLVEAGGVLDGIELFDAPYFGLTPREAAVLDPQHRLFMECAVHALEDAGHDPERFDGAIGVFGSASINTYLLLALRLRPDMLDVMTGLQVALLSDKDYMATRTSYALGLTGPSIMVQSACSSSLVAAHYACQSLLSYECDLALAGGVRVKVPQDAGYVVQPGDGLLASDAVCRPFDAEADGTVFGNGCGVVALRRLADALAGGDHVYAVILGSAVNNDGRRKVGFTAPSVLGQADVITEALAVAGLEGGSIQYIEAHGTGTRLGDPIELTALAEARAAAGACVLGAVKSNIGHLETAAGVAGLIKTALAIEHGEIPPTVNHRAPTTAFDMPAHGQRVATGLEPWPAHAGPRRAAVSSFGMGGTNAHMLLEQAPAPVPTTPGRAWKILVQSALDTASLARTSARLAARLRDLPALDLADVAFTLQVGRRQLPVRRAVVCRDIGEAIAALAQGDPMHASSDGAAREANEIAFLLPGQGGALVAVGQRLYETEAVFRTWLDRCADAFAAAGGIDVRALLWGAEVARRKDTRYTQPALFSLQLALARLLETWGLRPAAMLGHSLGELVAATLAGVFDTGDAIRLVSARAQLMAEQPPGSMLAVRLAPEAMAPHLQGGVTISAINDHRAVVVGGPADEIVALAARLDQAGVESRMLETSHAFHTPSMAAAAERLADVVRGVPLRAPEIPFISCVSGTWITAGEATSSDYWARQLRQPVRFSQGLDALAAASNRILLDLGPDQALSRIARRRGLHTVAVMPAASASPGPAGEDEPLARAVAAVWTAGVPVDWRGYHDGSRRRRVRLPGYSFGRTRHSLLPEEPAPAMGAPAGSVAPSGPADRPAPVTPAAQAYVPSTAASAGQHAADTPQRPALPSPYVPPSTALEHELVAVWEDTIGISGIGIDDDFFELGGESLMAATLLGRLRRRYEVELPLRALFESPTIRRLAELIHTERTSRTLPEQGEATTHSEDEP
jgi:phthiocerol/phenolphthiocerol synthesis type-I polyketide synthase E